MTVRFRIPGYLRPFAEGRPEVALPGPFANVGEALSSLGAQFPGVRDRVLMETGEVRPHVNVFVGEESIRYTGGLATPLLDGATVFIVPAISGGAGVAGHHLRTSSVYPWNATAPQKFTSTPRATAAIAHRFLRDQPPMANNSNR